MRTMMLCIAMIVNACAYGETPQLQHYGHSKGNTNDQDGGGTDNETDWVDDQIPTGCYLDTAQQDGVVVYSFVVCPNPQQQWKDIPDPDPFTNQKEKL